ncbi:PREDICTED: uncharacterized protein LOC109352909 [Lupinus angustifolius]|uniref:uncharacterized protein LOC109352909 n=1 Tax=Lupinus angustifolius TaxID=3871 RepID=UPI00092EB197|nr:PREDICTED: uncharacterized protein LOC109352909 [Lupinus angustifolius]
MAIPPGVVGHKPNQVCKLHKSIYGLKQASRQWYHKLSSTLFSLGYIQSQHDHSLFTKSASHHFTALLIYVDDLILAGTNSSEIDFVKHHLHNLFRIKDLGPLKKFLGLEIARNSKGITLCQRKYALDILSDTGFLSSKPTVTPMVRTTRLYQGDGEPHPDPASYRRLVGRLLYLTNIRPDLSFAVQQLTQFMASPTTTQHQALTRILRYIKSSPGQGLFYPSSSKLILKAFSDSDWATCLDTRKSISGFCVFLGDSLISWKSKKQQTVARSSSEAEYRALASTSCELQWITYLMQSLQIVYTSPALLYCDNTSACHIANNNVFHERTKHIEIDCHVVRERLLQHLFHLLPISSSEQYADILTKPLDPTPFHYLLSKMGVINIYSPV